MLKRFLRPACLFLILLRVTASAQVATFEKKGYVDLQAVHGSPDYVSPRGDAFTIWPSSAVNLRSAAVGLKAWTILGELTYSASFYWELNPDQLVGAQRTVIFRDLANYPDLVARYRAVRPQNVGFTVSVSLHTEDAKTGATDDRLVAFQVTENDLAYFETRSPRNQVVPTSPLKWNRAMSWFPITGDSFTSRDNAKDDELRQVLTQAVSARPVGGRHVVQLEIAWPDAEIDAIAAEWAKRGADDGRDGAKAPGAYEAERAAAEAAAKERVARATRKATERAAERKKIFDDREAAAKKSGDGETLANRRIEDLGLDLIAIQPGTFQMGNKEREQTENPVTRVTISKPFWLGRTEVTQAQWEAVMGKNPSGFKGANLPVETISWTDAMLFCERLTNRERDAGRLPTGFHYALPTEAQWEYACRAGTTGQFAGDVEAMAWHYANSGGRTHDVALKLPNAWGFYDMVGNVSEWCSDWFSNSLSLPGGDVTDPHGPPTGHERTVRGINFGLPSDQGRSSRRFAQNPSLGHRGLGLRITLISKP